MPSLKDFRNRITSVKSTQKITKAMQMVAAAKLRKAQEAAESAQPYSQRMVAVIANLAASMKDSPGAPKLMVGTGEAKTHLLVVMTADRGLCGGFNSSIVRLARERITQLEREGKTVKLFLIGGKGYDQLKRLYSDRIVERVSLRERKTIDSAIASELAEKIVAMFDAGAFDVASLLYSRFQSVISQVPTAQVIIPAAESVDEGASGPDLQGAIYTYEPEEEQILATLLPRNLSTQVFNALLQNAAGEQGARMSAMDNATRNAGEMIDALSLQYNRLRQANITKELIEIISGAEAL